MHYNSQKLLQSDIDTFLAKGAIKRFNLPILGNQLEEMSEEPEGN